MERLVMLCAALLWCGMAGAADPSYSAATIRSATDNSPEPFAPNSILSIFGSGMAWSERALTEGDIKGGRLPTSLGGVQVRVNGWPAALFFVSDGQVNFLLPGNVLAGKVTIQLARQGLAGPEVQVEVADTAPALFPVSGAPGYAIAQRWPEYSLIAPETPVAPGDIVILYAAGLGRTDRYPSPEFDEIPRYAGVIDGWPDFRVYLDGKPLDRDRVWYAGICPNWAGLYQVNFILPPDVGRDPEIRIGIKDKISPAGLRLAVY